MFESSLGEDFRSDRSIKFSWVLCVAFPYGQHSPAHMEQLPCGSTVSEGVLPDLLDPVWAIGGWGAAAAFAAVPMPEAPVDEDDRFMSRQDKIGSAGQLALRCTDADTSK